jgi:hypothetical protein
MVLMSGAALESYIYRGGSHPTTEPHGIGWVRSYWQKAGTWGLCIFDAPNLSVLSAFQDLCGTPFLDAMEVREAAGNPDIRTSVAATLSLGRAEGVDPMAEALTALGNPSPEVSWVYWSTERRLAVSLLAGEPETPREGLKIETGLVEIRPEDYA